MAFLCVCVLSGAAPLSHSAGPRPLSSQVLARIAGSLLALQARQVLIALLKCSSAPSLPASSGEPAAASPFAIQAFMGTSDSGATTHSVRRVTRLLRLSLWRVYVPGRWWWSGGHTSILMGGPSDAGAPQLGSFDSHMCVNSNSQAWASVQSILAPVVQAALRSRDGAEASSTLGSLLAREVSRNIAAAANSSDPMSGEGLSEVQRLSRSNSCSLQLADWASDVLLAAGAASAPATAIRLSLQLFKAWAVGVRSAFITVKTQCLQRLASTSLPPPSSAARQKQLASVVVVVDTLCFVCFGCSNSAKRLGCNWSHWGHHKHCRAAQSLGSVPEGCSCRAHPQSHPKEACLGARVCACLLSIPAGKQ